MGFEQEWAASRTRILSTRLLDLVVSVLPSTLSRRTATLLATIVYWLIFSLFDMALLRLLSIPILDVLPYLVITSFCAAASMLAVDRCYGYVLAEIASRLEADETSQFLDDGLVRWSRKYANIELQIASSVSIAIAISCAPLLFVGTAAGTELLRKAIPLIPVVSFIGSQSIYWAIASPIMTRIMRIHYYQYPHHVNPILPSRTPLLIAVSTTFTKFAWWFGLLTAPLVYVVISVSGVLTTMSSMSLIVVLVIVYSLVIWVYIFPHYNIWSVIRMRKLLTARALETSLHLPSMISFDRGLHFTLSALSILRLRESVMKDRMNSFWIHRGSTFLLTTTPSLLGALISQRLTAIEQVVTRVVG